MITVPNQQIRQRWDILPMSLREELTSFDNIRAIRKMCEETSLPPESVGPIISIMSLVLLGFMDPAGVAGEIKQDISVDAKTAGAVAEKLNKKIFSRVKNDLEKIYTPVLENEFKDIAPPASKETKLPVQKPGGALPKIVPLSAGAPQKNPVPAPVIVPVATAKTASETTPFSFVAKLKSFVSSAAPAAKPDEKKTGPDFSELPVPMSKVATPLPQKEKATPPPVPPGTKREASPAPAAPATPIVLQQTADFAPIPRAPSVRVGSLDHEFKEIKVSSVPPRRTAELEIGPAPRPPEKMPAPPVYSSPAPQRLVHYSPLKSSISPMDVPKKTPVVPVPPPPKPPGATIPMPPPPAPPRT